MGYVYNDLKADNICLGEYYTDEQMDDMEELDKIMNSVKLKLIDFGVSTRYLRIDQAGRECHT